MDTMTMQTSLTFIGSSPRAMDSLSPAATTFIRLARTSMMIIRTIEVTISTATASHDTPVRVPRLHSKISCICSASALNLMNVVKALNMYIIAIPMRIIIVELIRLTDETSIITPTGISENTNALAM